MAIVEPWPMTGQRIVKTWYHTGLHAYLHGPVIDLGRPDRTEPMPKEDQYEPPIFEPLRTPRPRGGRYGSVVEKLTELLTIRQPRTTNDLASGLAELYPGQSLQQIRNRISSILSNTSRFQFLDKHYDPAVRRRVIRWVLKE